MKGMGKMPMKMPKAPKMPMAKMPKMPMAKMPKASKPKGGKRKAF